MVLTFACLQSVSLPDPVQFLSFSIYIFSSVICYQIITGGLTCQLDTHTHTNFMLMQVPIEIFKNTVNQQLWSSHNNVSEDPAPSLHTALDVIWLILVKLCQRETAYIYEA